LSKREKLLRKWLNNPPKEVKKDEVLAVLDYYFSGKYENKPGSHIVITDDRLKDDPRCGPMCDFTVPIKGGQKVKGFYIKRLAEILKYLGEIE